MRASTHACTWHTRHTRAHTHAQGDCNKGDGNNGNNLVGNYLYGNGNNPCPWT